MHNSSPHLNAPSDDTCDLDRGSVSFTTLLSGSETPFHPCYSLGVFRSISGSSDMVEMDTFLEFPMGVLFGPRMPVSSIAVWGGLERSLVGGSCIGDWGV